MFRISLKFFAFFIEQKVLNRKKGPAVWGPRAQIDRKLYKNAVQNELMNTPNLDIYCSSVEDLLLNEINVEEGGEASKALKKCHGVLLKDGTKIQAKAVIITTGTFLRGEINIGLDIRPAGRIGDEPAIGLAKSLEALQFRMGRLKTGTPPRIKKDSIDFSNLGLQLGDSPPVPFSFLNDRVWIDAKEQVVQSTQIFICFYNDYNCPLCKAAMSFAAYTSNHQ